MTIRVRYTGSSNVRVINRTDLTGAGLADPGAALVFNQGNSFQVDVANAHAAFLIAQGDFAAVSGIGFGDFFAMTPIKVISEGAELNLGQVANAWHDVDPAGSAAARPTDVVIPNVVAGQWVAITLDAASFSATPFVRMDCWTIVGGVKVNQFGAAVNGNTGIVGWCFAASAFTKSTGTIHYQVQAGDIENGSVRIRLCDYTNSTTLRQITASNGFRMSLAGTGPFG